MGGKTRQWRSIGPEEIGDTPLDGYLAVRAQDFAHPWDVVLDPELEPDQKRTILAAWASDASAVESRPGFRWLAGTPGPVPVSHIRSALLALDQIAMPGSTAIRGILSVPSRTSSTGSPLPA